MGKRKVEDFINKTSKFDVNCTLSKKVMNAEIIESKREGTKGFNELDLGDTKIANVKGWAKAVANGVTYMVVLHLPKPRKGNKEVGKTYYKVLERPKKAEATA